MKSVNEYKKQNRPRTLADVLFESQDMKTSGYDWDQYYDGMDGPILKPKQKGGDEMAKAKKPKGNKTKPVEEGKKKGKTPKGK